MKCSKCNSENVVTLKTLTIDEHNITFVACKDCCNVDLYCLDFKKKNELMEKTNKILDTIYSYRYNNTINKKQALDIYLNVAKEINNLQLIDEINNAINEYNEYLNVKKLLEVKEENCFDDKGNIITKTVYYIEDFPVNYEDCNNGHNGLFFYLSKAKYKDLESVKNHKSDITILEILDEYYQKESINHSFIDITTIKEKDWYKSLTSLKLKDDINKIIYFYNK